MADVAFRPRFAKVPLMSRERPLFRLVLFGTLVAAFGLAGCGRKGPLDPPPAPASLVKGQGAPTGPIADAPSTVGPDGKPMAPPGPNKRIPLDVLLN